MKILPAIKSPLFVLLFVVLGCNMAEHVENAVGRSDNSVANTNINTNKANKTISERAMEMAVGEDLIGIPACDEALELLAAQANDPDDSVITQALKKTALNRFRAEVKRRLEEQKANRTDTEKYCSDFTSTLKSATADNTKPSP